ncbi:NAD(P)-dependent dehydrogenase (short-subunit alcohol dehydrogenase family) [Litorimonas taeanensis]|uniref:NAD(P)-dependent dehydrogenase (Short-subunit alcohol dehydrogenase family) n=1 Tax=Litorimonas taeanensis TaxID=568099 RepID=A0A420WK26_9PROT|nr:SDR family NAD(P)-dependent oxidoreductase [Litorimonas taeanensis]RKQ71255.1 NAD(P)-dependent dehydrogenase (short-subunit alcohol dehydrogenase family) [Litorimonas taeanensis]
MSKALNGRVTLVTGASRGIGYAASLALAEAGSDIIALARTQGGLEALDDAIKEKGQSCTIVPMDLNQAEGIDRLGAIINERWGKLDGLLANAGMLGDITPIPHLEPKTWDKLVSVNLTANYRLIRSLDPLLRASDAGRALFLTSGVANSRRAYWGAYAATKAGLEALVQCYAKETEVTNLKVNLLNPGATRTAMRAKAMPGEDPQTLPNPSDIAPLIVKMLSPTYAETDQIISYRDTL